MRKLINCGCVMNSSENGGHCTSTNSKGGLDLDAGAQVSCNNNGGDGCRMEQTPVPTSFAARRTTISNVSIGTAVCDGRRPGSRSVPGDIPEPVR